MKKHDGVVGLLFSGTSIVYRFGHFYGSLLVWLAKSMPFFLLGNDLMFDNPEPFEITLSTIKKEKEKKHCK